MRHRPYLVAQFVEIAARMIPEDKNDSDPVVLPALADLDYPTDSEGIYLPRHSLQSATTSPLLTWGLLSVLTIVLSTMIFFGWLSILQTSQRRPTIKKRKDPLQVPYFLPIFGNLIAYLLDVGQLASSIT